MIDGGHRLLSVLVWLPCRRLLASLAFWPMRCESLTWAKVGWTAVFVDRGGTRWATSSINRTWRRRP